MGKGIVSNGQGKVRVVQDRAVQSRHGQGKAGKGRAGYTSAKSAGLPDGFSI